MKSIIICEDVQLERDLLKEMLQRYFDEISEEIHFLEYESGEALLADAEEERVKGDLLFLDIYMKELTGMDVARVVRRMGSRVPIVFLTATPEFAVESYEVRASGYLLKPFSEEKLKKVLGRIFQIDFKKRIVLKTHRQYRYPYVDDILYIESDKHSIMVHLVNRTTIATTEKLGDIEKRIDESRFLRCHQSYLVNMDHVEDVQDDFILKDGSVVPIRVRGKKEVIDAYYHYFMKDGKNLGGGQENLKNRRILIELILNMFCGKKAKYVEDFVL